MDLGGVDRVAHVMTLAVGDKGDQALGLAELLADQLNDVDVRHLVVTADIIDLADPALADDQVDRLAVILDIEPVAHILALAVDGQGLVGERVGDHQGNQLLGEVIGTVVVGAARDCHRQSVGAVIREHEQVGARLGRAVGAAGMDGCLLGKEQVGTVERQVAVDLIGGDLVIARDAVLAAGVHQHLRAEDIGGEKDLGILDGAVDMTLRRKVDDDIRVLLLKQPINTRTVADIELEKTELRILHHAFERREIARIGQLVQTDDPVLRMSGQHVEHKITADKAGAACYNNGHTKTSR